MVLVLLLLALPFGCCGGIVVCCRGSVVPDCVCFDLSSVSDFFWRPSHPDLFDGCCPTGRGRCWLLALLLLPLPLCCNCRGGWGGAGVLFSSWLSCSGLGVAACPIGLGFCWGDLLLSGVLGCDPREGIRAWGM